MPSNQSNESDNIAAPAAQYYKKMLVGLLASVDWKNNPPLKISATIDLGLGSDFAPTASLKTEAQLFGKSLHAAHQGIGRRGRDGRGRPYL